MSGDDDKPIPVSIQASDTVRVTLAAIVAVFALAVLAGQQQQKPPRYAERVDVRRVLVDVHVVDDSGLPVRGLGPEDFQVRIDGKPARVEHARFIVAPEPGARGSRSPSPAGAPAPPASPSPSTASRPAPSPEWTDVSGRLIVLVFQRSMEPSRVVGLMKMQRNVERFIGSLGPGDRIAIAWFDSHLKLAADFTADRARLAAVVRKSVVWATPERLAPGPSPSLAAVFDYRAALGAGSIEQGLLVLGRALGQVPGPKAVILFGWGFGRLSGSIQLSGDPFGTRRVEKDFTHLTTDDEYPKARDALVAARASVFSVDVTDADTHSLEGALRIMSEETGGDYVKTVDFADAAFDRVARILSAQYELSVEKPDLPRGTHTIDVTLPHRHVTVFARKGYTD
jgi:VWFA-related protein